MTSNPFPEQPDSLAAAAFERAAREGLPPAPPRRSFWDKILRRRGSRASASTPSEPRFQGVISAAWRNVADTAESHRRSVSVRERVARDPA